MRLFHRTHIAPADVLALADEFFGRLGMQRAGMEERARRFSGPLGELQLEARSEGGHYTFIQAETDQIGESRLDKNVKKFFVNVHRRAEPAHELRAGY